MFVDYLSDHNDWVQKNLLDHLLKPDDKAETAPAAEANELRAWKSA
jgi:hypothetical protein